MFFLAFATSFFAGEAAFKIVEAEGFGEYIGKENSEYCWAEAESRAVEDAVRNAGGISVSRISRDVKDTRGISVYARTSVFQSSGVFLEHLVPPKQNRELEDDNVNVRYVCKVKGKIKIWNHNDFDRSFALMVTSDNAEQNRRFEKMERFQNGEILNFRLTTTHDAYLSVFWLDHTKTAYLVTQSNRDGEALKLKANKEYDTEKDFGLKFELYLSDPERVPTEKGTVLFVATKKRYAFLPNAAESPEKTYTRILAWIAEIPLNDRRMFDFDVTISKK